MNSFHKHVEKAVVPGKVLQVKGTAATQPLKRNVLEDGYGGISALCRRTLAAVGRVSQLVSDLLVGFPLSHHRKFRKG